MTFPHILKKFEPISWQITREIAFLGKITKIWIISKLEDVEKFQISCHHLYAWGYHAYRFGDSSINSVGGDAGKLFPDGRTDGER